MYVGHLIRVSNVFYGCQIVHWRTYLKFPEDANLSHEAKDLICGLLCDVEHRLGTGGAHQIKVLVCVG